MTGAYPSFVFGGRLAKGVLPVFHFHDITPAELEPCFAYLVDNGYRTVMADRLAHVARGESTVDPRTVALCFDDAWASLWTSVLPLLHKYDLTAITYVSPGRIEDADACRSVIHGGAQQAALAGPVFATWPELAALHASGRVDVQAHTFSHAMIFSSPDIIGFVSPETVMPLLSWPRTRPASDAAFLTATMLGHPLFPMRSRMSDACGLIMESDAPQRCCRHVADNGGVAFFHRRGWEQELREVAAPLPGRVETSMERDTVIAYELEQCRAVLAARLDKSVTHICMPWAICGKRAEALARELGFESVVADTLRGKRYVSAGVDPYRLMRLKHQYIPLLPGQGRRMLWSVRRGWRHD